MLLWGKNPGNMHKPIFLPKPLDSEDLSSHALSESKEDSSIYEAVCSDYSHRFLRLTKPLTKDCVHYFVSYFGHYFGTSTSAPFEMD